jgi:hypothetical protein
MMTVVRRPALLSLASLLLVLAFLTALSASGGGPTIGGAEVFLAKNGLRPTGVTLAASMDPGHTAAILTDASMLWPGQIIEVLDGSQSEIMQIVSVSADGNPATVDGVGVLRGQLGTPIGPHAAGKAISADFARMPVSASGIAPRATGVTLTQALNADLGEATAAVASGAVGSADTTIQVSDASVLVGAGLAQPLTARFDGMTFSSVSGQTAFLGSTGRNASCSVSSNQSSVTVSCHTLGATPANGPSGSGTLATVTLVGPKVPSIVNLTLSNVELVEVTVCNPHDPTAPCDPPLDAGEVIGGVALVGSPAPQAPSPPPDPTTGSPSVYISPKLRDGAPSAQISVDVRVDEIPAPGPTTGHGLGGYSFKLSWDHVPEAVTITGAKFGYLNDAGQLWDRGVTLTGAVGAADLSLPVNNGALLQPGWTAKIDSEELLIVSTSSNAIGVVRGYRGTSAAAHAMGAPVYAGPERITVTRPSSSFAHPVGSVLAADSRLLRVSDHVPLQGSMALAIDAEKFLTVQVPARTLQVTGRTLSATVDAVQTTLSLSGSGSIAVGDIIKIDTEFMAVTASSGSQITVVRGVWGTASAPHNHFLVPPIYRFAAEPLTARAVRAALGTSAASHASGAQVLDADGLGSYNIALQGPLDGTIALRAIRNSSFLGSSGRTPACAAPVVTSANASLYCTSNGTAVGAAGSGQVTTLDLSGVVLEPNAPTKTGTLTGSLTDVSGNDLAAKALANVALKVVKCPDVDGNRVANFAGDVITIAKAAFRIVTPATVHDIDNNGAYNFAGDAITAAKVVLLGQPVGLRCPPPQ